MNLSGKTKVMFFFFNPFFLLLSHLYLQAFVFFPDWSSCCSFVRSHVAKPVCVRDTPLFVHFVLEDMYPETTEVCSFPPLRLASKSLFKQVSLGDK